jgi:hypothetical protein
MFPIITMHHLRAIKAWADANGGQAQLDLSSFELEVKARNRFYRLLPQFIQEKDGRRLHVNQLSPEVTTFIGWRPYPPLRLSLSADKLVFKQALASAGLPTPAAWPSSAEARSDFVLKRSVGSFGLQLAGPFRQGALPTAPSALVSTSTPGKLFAEAFVEGENVKAWFWGARPVHLQRMPYATVRGDGHLDVDTLVTRRLAQAGKDWSLHPEREHILSSLAYQGVAPGTVPNAGQVLWLDYRYGRTFSPNERRFEAEDNAWHALPPEQRGQVTAMGDWLLRTLHGETRAPVLCTADGVLDARGTIWWLELNSNPVCPPNAYFAMLSTLFGTSAEAPATAYARGPLASQPVGTAT